MSLINFLAEGKQEEIDALFENVKGREEFQKAVEELHNHMKSMDSKEDKRKLYSVISAIVDGDWMVAANITRTFDTHLSDIVFNAVRNNVDRSAAEKFFAAGKRSILGEQTTDIFEAEYQGKKVELNQPFRNGEGPKKFSVYVKNGKGNVVKVNFGDENMEIKRDDPEARKSFRARHNCDEKKDPTTAGYWSCRSWSDSAPWI